MAFIRTNKRENPFVQIDKTFIEDPNLKWQSKGLMAYLLSRPDSWIVNQSDLINRANDGETTVRTALLDLMLHGYVYYYADRDDKGKIKEWIYEVYESPELNPFREEAQNMAKKKIEERKRKTKERNKKRLKEAKKQEKHPERDNHDLDKKQRKYPDRDNPDQDNPDQDNHGYNNNNLSNIKDIDIYIDTYKDTVKAETPVQQTEFLKQSLKDTVPPLIYETLYVFSEDFDQMYNYIGIIFRAKAKVQKKYKIVIHLEEHDNDINKILLACFRKFKTDRRIKNKDNYLFKSICKVLEEIAEKITGIEEEILRQREKNITSSNNELLDYLNRTINL